jgi:hypothetical protein
MMKTSELKEFGREMAAELGLDWEVIDRQIQQESQWNPTVRSPKGAVGLMQLMPLMSKHYGVDPESPIDNMWAGMQFMRKLLDKYNGNYEHALAGFHAGETDMSRVGPENYKEIGPETARYPDLVLRGYNWRRPALGPSMAPAELTDPGFDYAPGASPATGELPDQVAMSHALPEHPMSLAPPVGQAAGASPLAGAQPPLPDALPMAQGQAPMDLSISPMGGAQMAGASPMVGNLDGYMMSEALPEQMMTQAPTMSMEPPRDDMIQQALMAGLSQPGGTGGVTPLAPQPEPQGWFDTARFARDWGPPVGPQLAEEQIRAAAAPPAAAAAPPAAAAAPPAAAAALPPVVSDIVDTSGVVPPEIIPDYAGLTTPLADYAAVTASPMAAPVSPDAASPIAPAAPSPIAPAPSPMDPHRFLTEEALENRIALIEQMGRRAEQAAGLAATGTDIGDTFRQAKAARLGARNAWQREGMDAGLGMAQISENFKDQASTRGLREAQSEYYGSDTRRRGAESMFMKDYEARIAAGMDPDEALFETRQANPGARPRISGDRMYVPKAGAAPQDQVVDLGLTPQQRIKSSLEARQVLSEREQDAMSQYIENAMIEAGHDVQRMSEDELTALVDRFMEQYSGPSRLESVRGGSERGFDPDVAWEATKPFEFPPPMAGMMPQEEVDATPVNVFTETSSDVGRSAMGAARAAMPWNWADILTARGADLANLGVNVVGLAKHGVPEFAGETPKKVVETWRSVEEAVEDRLEQIRVGAKNRIAPQAGDVEAGARDPRAIGASALTDWGPGIPILGTARALGKTAKVAKSTLGPLIGGMRLQERIPGVESVYSIGDRAVNKARRYLETPNPLMEGREKLRQLLQLHRNNTALVDAPTTRGTVSIDPEAGSVGTTGMGLTDILSLLPEGNLRLARLTMMLNMRYRQIHDLIPRQRRIDREVKMLTDSTNSKVKALQSEISEAEATRKNLISDLEKARDAALRKFQSRLLPRGAQRRGVSRKESAEIQRQARNAAKMARKNFNKDIQAVKAEHGPIIRELKKQNGKQIRQLEKDTVEQLTELKRFRPKGKFDRNQLVKDAAEIEDVIRGEWGDEGIKAGREFMDEWRKWNWRATIQPRIDAGRLTQRAAEAFRDANPHYVPFQPPRGMTPKGQMLEEPMEEFENMVLGLETENIEDLTQLVTTGLPGMRGVKALEQGTVAAPYDPLVYGAENSQNVMRQMLRQMIHNETGSWLDEMVEAEPEKWARAIVKSDTPEGMKRLIEEGKKNENISVFEKWVDGRRTVYRVSEPELVKEINSLNPKMMNWMRKAANAAQGSEWIGVPMQLARLGMTMGHDFLIRAPLRDLFNAMYSRGGYIPGVDTVRGIYHTLKSTPESNFFRLLDSEYAPLVQQDRPTNVIERLRAGGADVKLSRAQAKHLGERVEAQNAYPMYEGQRPLDAADIEARANTATHLENMQMLWERDLAAGVTGRKSPTSLLGKTLSAVAGAHRKGASLMEEGQRAGMGLAMLRRQRKGLPYNTRLDRLQAAINARARGESFGKAWEKAGERKITDFDIQTEIKDPALDFARKGDLARMMDSAWVFTSPMLADLSKFARSMKERPLATMTKGIAGVTAWKMQEILRFSGTEEYEKLRPSEKARNIYVNFDEEERKWLRFPMPPGLPGMIFGNIPAAGLENLRETDPAAFEAMRLSAIGPELEEREYESKSQANLAAAAQEGLPFGNWVDERGLPKIPSPTLLEPAQAVRANWDPRFGRKVVGSRDSRFVPSLQTGADVTHTAELLGGITESSPKKVQYLMDRYMGGAVRNLLGAAEDLGESTGVLPDKPGRGARVPGKRVIFGRAGSWADEVYGSSEEIEAQVRSIEERLLRGGGLQVPAVMANFSKFRTEVANMAKVIRLIQFDKNISESQREDKILKIAAMREDLLSMWMDNVRGLEQ